VSDSAPAAGAEAPTSVDSRLLPARLALARLASRGEDATTALRTMLDLFQHAFRADGGAISLISPDTGRLRTEVQAGITGGPGSVPELKPGHGVTGWCALNRRSLLVPDVRLEPRYISVRPTTRCEMAAPLLLGEQVIGIVDLESDQPAAFSPADLAALELLAAEAAQVMQRLWELGHLRGKARQLEALISAGQSLVTKLEEQALFDTFTREARRMFDARACGLYLYDAARHTLRCAALTSEHHVPAPAGDHPLDACLFSSPVQTRRPIWFSEIQSPDYRDLPDLPVDASLRSVLATPLLFEGEVLGVLAVFHDHLQRYDNDGKRLSSAFASLGAVALQNTRLYSRVFQSEDVLRKNERLTTLGLLAAEIAHEIRNPLTVIKLLHGGLGLDFPAGDPRRTDLRVIAEKLDQLEAIVTRVLGFAKAPSSLHSRWPLADIIQDTLMLVRLKLAQHKVSVAFEPPARPLFVEVHKGQIQQVLLNLLLNATHAMPEGGTIRITLETAARSGHPQACIDLADTGSGVDPAIRERIFDSFLSGRPDGTGLGLAIAKRILLSHHGDITLLATGPTGTTMRVTLPLAR
jgi:signal transduction histidine kinase